MKHALNIGSEGQTVTDYNHLI